MARQRVDFKIGDFLSVESSTYEIKKFLGEGVFGKVAACINVSTKEEVAVKMVRKKYARVGKKEVDTLEKLKELDENKNNLVRFIEHFVCQHHVCLVFEMLDTSLHGLMQERRFEPLPLSEIRVITQQMLVALHALKSINLVHADIKPDNVMLVNHKFQPLKLKLIDFGLATPLSRLRQGKIIQALGYRAPEVVLGLPLNEAVDMWALGCLLAFLYLGRHLYPVPNEHELMRAIVQTHRQPDDHLLNSGIFTDKHFSKDTESSNTPWKLIKSPNARAKGFVTQFTSLNEMVKTHPGLEDSTVSEDTRAFLSLLKHMLEVDPEKRIAPSEGLGHRFITMKHFDPNTANTYVKTAYMTVENCQLQQSWTKFKHFVTSSEAVSLTLTSFTSLSVPLSANEANAVDSNNRSPASDYVSAEGTDQKPRGANEADFPASVKQNADGMSTGRDKAARSIAEVKTQKNWKRRFFHKLMFWSS